MGFTPRTYETILNDMINYVKAHSTLTDMEIGSNIRTILEAASLEDDEIYFQCVNLLDAFSINNASGTDLDARAADSGVIRLQPAASAGQVVIQDETLIKSTLSLSAG